MDAVPMREGREGQIVGDLAPPIDVANVGHRMLSRMGMCKMRACVCWCLLRVQVLLCTSESYARSSVGHLANAEPNSICSALCAVI